MIESEQLSDCFVAYHFTNGATVYETFRNDIPKKVWKEVMSKFLDGERFMELQGEVIYANIMVVKSAIAYISLEICD